MLVMQMAAMRSVLLLLSEDALQAVVTHVHAVVRETHAVAVPGVADSVHAVAIEVPEMAVAHAAAAHRDVVDAVRAIRETVVDLCVVRVDHDDHDALQIL